MYINRNNTNFAANTAAAVVEVELGQLCNYHFNDCVHIYLRSATVAL